MTLWHFTCSHGAAGIRREGLVRVSPVSWARYDIELLSRGGNASRLEKAPSVAWFTDMDRPERDAVGLTSRGLDCDRMAYRVTVETDAAQRWLDFAAEHGAALGFLADLHRYGNPEHWWVATSDVPVASIELVAA